MSKRRYVLALVAIVLAGAVAGWYTDFAIKGAGMPHWYERIMSGVMTVGWIFHLCTLMGIVMMKRLGEDL